MSVSDYAKIVVLHGIDGSSFAGYRSSDFLNLLLDTELRKCYGLPQIKPESKGIFDHIGRHLAISGRTGTINDVLWCIQDYEMVMKRLNDPFLRSVFKIDESSSANVFASLSNMRSAFDDFLSTAVLHYSEDRVAKAISETHRNDMYKNDYSMFQMLASENDSGSPFLPVFLCGYEMLFEDIVSALDSSCSPVLPVTNGFFGENPEGTFWTYEPYDKDHHKTPRGFYLHRLRGCVCWYFHSFADHRVYFHRADAIAQNRENICAFRRSSYLPEPVAFAHQRLQEYLMQCRCVVVIGYNFLDLDINHALISTNALRKAPLFFVVLNRLLTPQNILRSLRDSARILPGPVALPDLSEIICTNGDSGFMETTTRLLNTIKNLPSTYSACFVSYSHSDEEFARLLCAELNAKNVRTWLAVHDMKGGEKVYDQVSQAIETYDRVLLVISEHSMYSQWVQTEIAIARRREVAERRSVLFPIRLVDFDVIRTWECFDSDLGKDSAREIREYHIPDFSHWRNPELFRKALNSLLIDLAKSE